jgi:hypothetical protein
MRTMILLMLGVASTSLVAGCMYPSNYYGNQYPQQMYSPPGNLSQPGTLYIPPSNAPPYNPANSPSTYDEPTDTWSNPDTGSDSDSRFFGEDGDDSPVPDPRDAGSGTRSEPFGGDFGSGT